MVLMVLNEFSSDDRHELRVDYNESGALATLALSGRPSYICGARSTYLKSSPGSDTRCV